MLPRVTSGSTRSGPSSTRSSSFERSLVRYLIAMPVCLILVSGVLWFTARGSYPLAAQDDEARIAPESGAPLPIRGERSGSAQTASSSSSTEDGTGAAFDPILVNACTLTPIQEQDVASPI